MNTYLATVTEDLYVVVTIDGVEVDRPGPWANADSAHQWAAEIVTSLEAGNIHYECQHE